jgi:hypothetical protein
MRLAIWGVALAVAACGSKATTGGVDARPDTAIGSAGVVACGTVQQPTTCVLSPNPVVTGAQCCDFPPGAGTDYCYAVPGGTCEGGVPIACDGPEDCTGAQSCCYTPDLDASCNDATVCVNNGGSIMCHVGDDSPCGTSGHCCALHSVGPSSGSVFGICMTSCPV